MVAFIVADLASAGPDEPPAHHGPPNPAHSWDTNKCCNVDKKEDQSEWLVGVIKIGKDCHDEYSNLDSFNEKKKKRY